MNSYSSLAQLYDSFSFDRPADEWAGYIDSLLEKSGIQKGFQVLDAACGTGSITQELYKLGYKMTALDLSQEMLEIAAGRFHQSGYKIPIINQDIKQIDIPKKSDAVVCINDAVNYLISDEDVSMSFKSISNALKQGGIFLFDISAAYKLMTMDDKTFFEENDEGLYIWNSDFDKTSSTLTMDLSLYSHLEDDLYEKTLETHVQKAHEVSFLENALWKAGFTDIKTYECFTQSSPDNESERIQFAARKK